MKEQIVSRIAVIILAIVLIVIGIYHFLHPRDMLNFVPNFLPGGIKWVYVVGIAFILAGIAFIIHKWVKLAGYLLAFMLIVFVFVIHLPNYFNAGNMDDQKLSLLNMLKDSAIAAFAMYIASNAQKI
jgi:putative oxidoreductase